MRMTLARVTPAAGTWLVVLLASTASQAAAQQPKTKHVKVPVIAARTEDVSTIDGIIKAFYEVISGPAGQPREWGRDRTLYMPGVKFVAVGAGEGESKPQVTVMDHQEFVDRVDEGLVKEGFYEREIHRVTRSFGAVTHVFSTYEMSATPDGPIIGRGVNSLGLYDDGTRWWIASAMWDEERPGNPIPKEFLPE